MIKNLNIKKILNWMGIAIIGILLIISLFDAFKPNSFQLTVETIPQDATIKINDEIKGTGQYQERLERGEYTILATKEGYNSEVRKITLDKPTSVTLNLISTNTASINITTSRSTPVENTRSIANSNLYSVDSQLGYLLSTENGQTRTVYSGQVRDYSVNESTAVILDYRDLSAIVVVNTQNGSTRKIDLSSYSPVISVTLSDNSQTIYFLAKFDIEKKNPVLYSMNSQEGAITELTETRALKVEHLKDSKVILYENVHALDQSIVHVFDTSNKIELYSGKANVYSLSPSKSHLSLQTSRNLTIVNTENFESETTSLTFADFSAWKDDSSLIVLRNRGNSVEYGTVNLNPITQSSFNKIIEGKQVRSLLGVAGNKATFIDLSDTVFTFDIPQ